MVLFFLTLAVGFASGISAPDSVREPLRKWVRGAWGWARGLALGAARAPEPLQNVEELRVGLVGGARAAVHNPPSNPPFSSATGAQPIESTRENRRAQPDLKPDFARALSNIASFFLGCLSWIARNPKAALSLAILALILWGVFVWRPFDGLFGQSKDALRLERDYAERTQAVQRETNRASHEEGERFRSNVVRIDTALDRAREQVESARTHETLDFLRTWAAADRGLLLSGSSPG